MNAKVKRAWIRALRSGKYRRGMGQLRENTPRGPKFCCLGVLCDLYAKATKTPWSENGDFQGNYAFLPLTVQTWAEVDQNPTLGREQASDWNDNGTSFNRISTLIEKHL